MPTKLVPALGFAPRGFLGRTGLGRLRLLVPPCWEKTVPEEGLAPSQVFKLTRA